MMTQANPRCDVIMLATPEIDEYSSHSRSLWSRYCAARGYQFHHYSDRLVPDMHVNWSKIEMVRRHLAASDADVVTLVDADTYVCNPGMSLTGLLNEAPGKQMLFSRDMKRYTRFELPLDLRLAIAHGAWRLPNAGFIVMKNSDFAKYIFDAWLDLARNRLKHLSDKHPRNQRVLWRGLYFQNRDKIGLLDGRITRLQSEDQVDRALHQGCDVLHLRGGMSHAGVERLTNILARGQDR